MKDGETVQVSPGNVWSSTPVPASQQPRKVRPHCEVRKTKKVS